MKKHKIPLQLYDVFTFDRANRSERLLKHSFYKLNRSEGLQKQEIPLQLYALIDAKTLFQQPKRPKSQTARAVCSKTVRGQAAFHEQNKKINEELKKKQ